jgi:hypothetical protein
VWLKLLYGVCILAQLAECTGMGSSSSSSNGVCGGLGAMVLHPVIAKVVSFVCNLTKQLQSGSVTVQQLQQLQLHRDALLQLTAAVHAMQGVAAVDRHVAAAIASCSAADVEEALAAAEAALQQQSEQQQLLELFCSVVCPSLNASVELDAYVADMSGVEGRLRNCQVRDLSSSDAWGMHWLPLQAAVQAEGLLDLTVFRNSLTRFAAAERAADSLDIEVSVWSGDGNASAMPIDQEISTGAASCSRRVQDVLPLMPLLLQHFQAQWAAATELQTAHAACSSSRDGPSVAAVLSLWASEQPPDVANGVCSGAALLGPAS